MTTNLYAKAYTEVLEIIRYFSKEEYSKIPSEKIEFYENNKDKEYKFTINPEIDLGEQNISKEANAILITLFKDYFATKKQQEILESLLKQNQEKYEKEKRELYDPNNIFKKSNEEKEQVEYKENINKELQITEYKETFFIKFKKFIFKLLNK